MSDKRKRLRELEIAMQVRETTDVWTIPCKLIDGLTGEVIADVPATLIPPENFGKYVDYREGVTLDMEHMQNEQ